MTTDQPIIIGQLEAQSLAFGITALTNTIYFTNCIFVNYTLSGPEQNTNFLSLNLSGTKIMQSFSIENFTVKDLVGPNLMNYGIATIRNVSIEKSVNLSFANFNSLIFQNVLWPNTAEGLFSLDGFTYNHIIPGEGLYDSNWHELLDFINASNYNVKLYRDLESYFDEQGHSDWSDEVFIAQKRRERSDLLKWYSLKWWWNLFLDGFILFGQRPSRAFLWSIFVIIIGAFVFKKEKMINVGKGDKLYNSLWYSLDLFIPYIDLGISNNWEISSKEVGAINYKRIHLILGWVVIPIALLSISGYFK